MAGIDERRSSFHQPAFPSEYDINRYAGLLPPGRHLGDNTGPIYFTDQPPAPDTNDPRFGNRVFKLNSEVNPSSSEVLLVVTKSTEPTLVNTNKARTISVLKGNARVLILRADGSFEDLAYLGKEFGRPEEHSTFTLHQGDSYAIIRSGDEDVVCHDISTPEYEIGTDEVRSEALDHKLTEILNQMGYLPENIWDEVRLNPEQLNTDQLERLAAAIQARIESARAKD